MNKPQRNHISTIIFQVFKYIKSNFYFVIILFINNELIVSIGIFAGVFILMTIFSTLVWFNKKFYLKENMLYYQTGIINKKLLTLSKENISTIDMGQSLLQRIIGVYRLKIDSGSTNLGKTEIDIVLNKEKIESIRQAIENTEMPKKYGEFKELQQKEMQVFKCSNKELFLLALTKNKIGVTVTLIFSAMTFMDDVLNTLKIDIGQYIDRYLNIDVIMKKSMGQLAVFIIQLFVLAYIISFIISVVTTFVKYYDFKIYKENNKLNIQYGIISLKKYSFPIKNIQAIKLKQTLLNQWFHQYRVEIVTAGYGDEEKEEAVFYPLANKAQLSILIDALIPEFKFEHINPVLPPKKAIKRFFIFPVTLSVILFGGVSILYYKAMILFLLLPFILFSCYMSYKNATIGYDKDILYGSSNSLGKTTVIIKMDSVQSITESTNYFQRKMGVCNYMVDFYSSKIIDLVSIPNMSKEHFKEIEKVMSF